MKWENPKYFILLIVYLPLLITFFGWMFYRKKKLLQRFCERDLLKILTPHVSTGRQVLRAAMILYSVGLVILALCRPQFGFQWEEVKRSGVDILVAVDVSSSMLAQDVEPNRLERARREIVDLLRLLKGDRIGLIAFAGVPYLECPLTLDYGAIPLFLDYLNTDLIPVPGTAIADAMALATQTFKKQGSRNKALILITDGEDHGGDPVAAAKEAKKEGIKVFTIGIGKDGGAPIPAKEGGGFRKDRQGNLILSKLDETVLKNVALETGGIYVRSVTGDLDLEKIYTQEIRQGMEHTELESSKRRRWEERYQWPLGMALALLFLEPLIPERRKVK